jgi:hypothetical protein
MRHDATGKVSASFTRPNDTTPYAAKDAVSDSTSAPTILTFAGAAKNLGGSGYITGARLTKSNNGVTNASFRLWLFSEAVTPMNDNSPYTLLWDNRDKRIGYIDFTMTSEGTGSTSAEAQAFNQNIHFTCASNSKDIYGLVEANSAWTPTALEILMATLYLERN